MTRRMKLILARPADDSLEAFVAFRKNTTLKLTKSKTILMKNHLVNEWEKYWKYMNRTPGSKILIGNYVN